MRGWGFARLPLYALGYTNHTEIRGSVVTRADGSRCRRSHRRGEKKVANQLLADGATTPGRGGCNVPGLLIPRWKLCPLHPDEGTWDYLSRTWAAAAVIIFWFGGDSVRTIWRTRVHRQWLLRQHNNAVSRVEKLSRDRDGGRRKRGWRDTRRGISYDVRVIDPRTYVPRYVPL